MTAAVEGQLGLRSMEERPGEITAQGNPPERLAATVEAEMLKPVLT